MHVDSIDVVLLVLLFYDNSPRSYVKQIFHFGRNSFQCFKCYTEKLEIFINAIMVTASKIWNYRRTFKENKDS